MPFPLLALIPTILSGLASGASAVFAAGAAGAATGAAAAGSPEPQARHGGPVAHGLFGAPEWMAGGNVCRHAHSC